MPRPHHRPIKLGSLGMGPAHQHFLKLPGGLHCVVNDEPPGPSVFSSQRPETLVSEMTELSSGSQWWSLNQESRSPDFLILFFPSIYFIWLVVSLVYKLHFRSTILHLYLLCNKVVSKAIFAYYFPFHKHSFSRLANLKSTLILPFCWWENWAMETLSS